MILNKKHLPFEGENRTYCNMSLPDHSIHLIFVDEEDNFEMVFTEEVCPICRRNSYIENEVDE